MSSFRIAYLRLLARLNHPRYPDRLRLWAATTYLDLVNIKRKENPNV